MKIALVRMRYVLYGGAENYLTLVANELVTQGHEVHIFSHRWKGDNRSFIFHKVPVVKGNAFLRALSFSIGSYLLLKKERLDIIISFDRILHQDIYRAGDGCHREWLEQRKRIESPLKSFLVMMNPFHRTMLYLERKIYQGNGSKMIITNSYKSKEDILRYYQVDRGKINVIYNGVDLIRFSPSNRNRYRYETRKKYNIGIDETVLLFVGTGFERKGLKFLLEAVSLLKKGCNMQYARCKVLVVGKGDYDYYKKMARDLGIEKDIIFVGTTDMIEKFYAASDVFILPSIYDPFSNACLEAMASGIPVITTKNNGASEIIENGKDGFILEDPSNVDEMVTSIRILMDRNLRETLGERARDKAEEFSIEDTVRKMVGICE